MFWMVVVEPISLVEVGGAVVLVIALVTVGWGAEGFLALAAGSQGKGHPQP